MPSPAKKSATTAAKSAAKPAEAKPAEAKNDAPAKGAMAKAAVPVKPAAGTAKPAATRPVLSPAERMKMIAEAAYFLAQKRGFSGGNELSDWVAAEKQVDSLLIKRG